MSSPATACVMPFRPARLRRYDGRPVPRRRTRPVPDVGQPVRPGRHDAVGNDINLRVLPSLVGAGAVLILTAAGALGLVITTWYRRSRPADDR